MSILAPLELRMEVNTYRAANGFGAISMVVFSPEGGGGEGGREEKGGEGRGGGGSRGVGRGGC